MRLATVPLGLFLLLGFGCGAADTVVRADSGSGGQVCAVGSDAYVRCWGHGGQGRLGYGAEELVSDNPDDVITAIPVFRPVVA